MRSIRSATRVTLTIALLLAVAVVIWRPFAGTGEPVSVLFVGNSYTTTNNLAGVFSELAGAGGYDADVEVVAQGGAWLRDHVQSGRAAGALAGGDWDYVVLQEQSVVPASPTERLNAMFPAVREIVSIADDWNTEPVLFLTWARRDGFADVGYNSYEPMQRAITGAYEEIAAEEGIRIAPVGEAWSIARRSDYSLYQADGSHPAPAGTYLAAAVIYSTIFGQDATAAEYSGSLDERTGSSLRWIAARTVLDEPDRWHLPVGSSAP